MSAAARGLGLGRSTLYRRIKKLAIDLSGEQRQGVDRRRHEVHIEIGSISAGDCLYRMPSAVEHVAKQSFVFRRPHRVERPRRQGLTPSSRR